MLDKLFKNKIFIYLYTAILFSGACIITFTAKEVEGAIIYGYIAAVSLILSSRMTDAMLPAMLLSVFVTKCYDSSAVFMAKIPWLIPIVLAIISHFIIYRKIYVRNLRIGKSFWGLVAVAISVTLGGIGTISLSDYFRGSALYYVFGLGIGMIIFYLLVKANFTEESEREVARVMYITGLFACFCVFNVYLETYAIRGEITYFAVFQSSNNLATFLMLAMPFPLFYAPRRYIDILSVVVMYIFIFLTGSRGGLLMGTAEFLLIFICFAIFDRSNKVNRFIYSFVLISFIITGICFLPKLAAFHDLAPSGITSISEVIGIIKDRFLIKGEQRMLLIDRMFDDFISNPIFGTGIGYTGNTDIYNPKAGAMNWYHMWFAQVIGGLGIMGILAYGYQLIERIKIFFANKSLLNFVCFMSYTGLFMMSQVNPGEFCPMPYAALAVTLFIIMEKRDNDTYLKNLYLKISTKKT